MERVWLGIVAGVAALVFACAPAFAAAAAAAPTAGAEPGVTIDEGSPAAKEYALALTQARHTGSSNSGASRSGSSEAPFGTGITPPSSGGASGTGGSHSNGGPSGGPKHPGARATKTGLAGASPRSAPSLPAAVLQANRTGSGGDGSLLALLGGGVAILVLGTLGGVVLRHNRRPPSHA